jgi:hypothetical protein
MTVWIVITDASVYMRERGGWDGESTGSRRSIFVPLEVKRLPVWLLEH